MYVTYQTLSKVKVYCIMQCQGLMYLTNLGVEFFCLEIRGVSRKVNTKNMESGAQCTVHAKIW